MSSVEETAPDQTGRRGTWWSATVQWRNWPLLVKLGMVLVVPVVSALVLGVLRVRADVQLADSYTATERVAALRTQFVAVLAAVEQERDQALRVGGQLDPAAKATDQAVAAMKEVVRRDPELGDPTSGYGALVRALDTLPAARRQVTGGAEGTVVLSAYNAVVNPVLEYDRSLVGRFPDEDLAGTSLALSELLGMTEQVRLEQAIGNLALRDRALPEGVRQLLVESAVRLDDKLEDFRSQAPPELTARYDDAVQGDNVIAYERLVNALRTTDPAALPFTQDQWDRNSNATVALMNDLTRSAATGLRADSAALAESISNRAGLESVLLLTMVLLAAGIGGGLGRYLLRSVGTLRRTALDVAHERLPAAVASIRKGENVVIQPVPLASTEEFGQLARAFDAVNDQAVRSAAEEASLRSNLANIFTNLSRRSQGLVERQLRLMEQLEQKTEDPEQLENLFKIDHLATRMRRNNENLMVLSGTGLLRRFAEPMPLPDVLRAAISEVEHYQRAVVRSVPDVRIAGYAAGDLIRSISELIENATAFSPPDAQVTIAGRLLQDGSVVIDIVDRGVGMGERELREANEKIAGGGGVDVPISRQMGLFVIGRLTSRHGIHVRLIPRAEDGLCASVLVPAGLVNIADPGQTAVIGMPVAGGGPGTAAEWLGAVDRAVHGGPGMPDPSAAPLVEPVEPRPAAAAWVAPAARTDEPWVTAAGEGSPLPKRGAAEQPESPRTTGEPWLTTANDGAPLPKRGGPTTADDEAPLPRRGAGEPWLTTASESSPLPKRGATEQPDGAGEHTEEPWLATATPVEDAGTRSMAASWLTAAKKAESGEPLAEERPATANWLEAARGGAQAPAHSPAPGDERADETPEPAGDDAPTQVALPAVAREVPAEARTTTFLPYERFEPVEVARQLESAGIVVTLPELPSADTPASILFADNTMGGDGGQTMGGDGREPGFSWLRTKPGARPATVTSEPAETPVVTTGPAGLPKRVPRGHLQGATRGQPPSGQPPAASRNADRARGFLSGFQAGIRQSENREGESGS